MSTKSQRLSELLTWFVSSWFIGYLAVGAALVQLDLNWPQIILVILLGTTLSIGLNGLVSRLTARAESNPTLGSLQALLVGLWTILLTSFLIGYGSLMGGTLLESLDWSPPTLGTLICLALSLGVSALLQLADDETLFWLRIAFAILIGAFTVTMFYGARTDLRPLTVGSADQLLFGLGLVFLTSSIWLQSALTILPSGSEPAKGWLRALGGAVGPIFLTSMGAVLASISESATNQLIQNPATGLSNLVSSPFLVPTLAVCVIAQIAFSSANVTVIEQTLTHFGAVRGGKWISLVLIALFSTATIFGQGLMEQIFMQAAIVFAALVGVLVVSLLLPSRTNTLAYAAFLIGAGAGVAVTMFWENLLNMTWIIGIITAATVGAVGAAINRFIVGPKRHKTEAVTEDVDSTPEPDLSPGDLLAARVDFPENFVEEAIDELVAPQPARGVTADENADIENWVEDSNRGLSGVFRADKFDESQQELANQPRPSRAMSQVEQDELEAWLTDTGTLSVYIDDGSEDSPARPRRVLIEDELDEE